MPHFPGHRKSLHEPWNPNPGRLQGLLGKGQGQGLFGPNIRQGGVGLSPGRNTIIAPNPAAAGAMGSAINRLAPRGAPTPAPTSPRVMNTGGTSVADLFKGAKLGQFGARVGQPAAPSTLGGYGQFGPQAAQAQQVQGGPPTAAQGVNTLAAAAGQKLAGQQGAEGPETVLDPAQSFFSRMVGEKGSGKRSDIGRSMMSAGAAMMKGSPDGTFATIGQGLETGLAGYQDLKEKRREESAWDQDEKRRKEIEAGIGASIGEVADDDGNITRRALTEEEEARVRAVGGPEGIALAREIRQGTKKRDAINKYAIGADDARLNLLMSYDNDKALDEVVKYAQSQEGVEGRIAHLKQMGYSEEVAKLAAKDPAATQAVLNRGMETTIMRDGSGVLRIFHDGDFVGSAGEGAPEITAAEADNLELAKQSVLWDQSDGARQRVRESHAALLPKIEDLPTLVSTIEKVNDDTVADYFKPLGKMNLELDRWLGLDDADLGYEVGQMLETFGIRNLDAFTGAISDRELVVALRNAGEIGQPAAMINAILQRSIQGTIDAAIEQNVGAKEMDKMLAMTEVAQAAVNTGQEGLWTNSFGFTEDQIGSEGTLNEETGLYEGGTGLMGMRTRTNQAVEDALDRAIEEAEGLIMVDPETGVEAQPLTPVQAVSGFGGGQSIVRGIAGIPGLLADPVGKAARNLYGDDGRVTRSEYEREN